MEKQLFNAYLNREMQRKKCVPSMNFNQGNFLFLLHQFPLQLLLVLGLILDLNI